MNNQEQQVPPLTSPSGKVLKQNVTKSTFQVGEDAAVEIRKLVHRDQREERCRPLEYHLANAANVLTENPGGYYKITVAPVGVSFGTLANRLTSARAGFVRYAYSPTIIPEGFNLKRLRISEVEDGVLITLWPGSKQVW